MGCILGVERLHHAKFASVARDDWHTQDGAAAITRFNVHLTNEARIIIGIGCVDDFAADQSSPRQTLIGRKADLLAVNPFGNKRVKLITLFIIEKQRRTIRVKQLSRHLNNLAEQRFKLHFAGDGKVDV